MIGIIDLTTRDPRSIAPRRVCGVYPSVAGALVAAGERLADGAERVAVVVLASAWTPEALDVIPGAPLIVVTAQPALTPYLTVDR
jgi:hypothetical protein